MPYPFTDVTEASAAIINQSNQIHQVVNGDKDTTVQVDEGQPIPSLRKAINDVTEEYSSSIKAVLIDNKNYTLEEFRTHVVNTSGMSVTLTLPNASKGSWVKVRDKAGTFSTNAVGVVASGGALINGSTNYGITTNFEVVTFVFDGTDWYATKDYQNTSIYVDYNNGVTNKTTWLVPSEFVTTQAAWNDIKSWDIIKGSGPINIIVTDHLIENSLRIYADEAPQHLPRLVIKGNTSKDTDSITFTTNGDGLGVYGSCNLSRGFLMNISLYHTTSTRYALALGDGVCYSSYHTSLNSPRIQSLLVASNSRADFRHLHADPSIEHRIYTENSSSIDIQEYTFSSDPNSRTNLEIYCYNNSTLRLAAVAAAPYVNLKQLRTANALKVLIYNLNWKFVGSASTYADLGGSEVNFTTCKGSITGNGGRFLLSRRCSLYLNGGELELATTDGIQAITIFGSDSIFSLYATIVTGSGKAFKISEDSVAKMTPGSGSVDLTAGVNFTYETLGGGYFVRNGALIAGSLPS